MKRRGAPRGLRIGLRAQLVALVLAVSLPMLGFGVAAVWELGRRYHEGAEARLHDTARALALAVDRELEGGIAALSALAASPLIDRGDFETFHQQARSVGQSFGGWVVLTDLSLRQLVNTLREPGEDLQLTLSGADAARAALTTMMPTISDVVIGVEAQEPIAPIIVPVLRQGAPTHLLVLAFKLGRLSDLLAAQGLSEHSHATILDAQQTTVARSENEALVGQVLPAGAARRLEAARGELQFGTSLEGEPIVRAAAPLQRAPWTLVVTESRSVYEAAWLGPLERLAIAGTLLALAAAAAAFVLGRSLVQPMLRLVRRAEAVAQGLPPPADDPPPHTAELVTLRDALVKAEEAVRRRALAEGRTVAAEEAAAELSEREMRFRALAESIPQLVWVSGPDGRNEYFNARWYEFTGSSAPFSTEAFWRDIIHPDDLHGAAESWQNAMKRGEPVEGEVRLRRTDGAWRWFLTRSVPLRDAQGRVLRWFGTLTDITEFVEARETSARKGEALERTIAERSVQLAESEARFRAIFDAQFQFIGLLSAEGTLLAMNRPSLEFAGVREEEIVGRPLWNLPFWADDPAAQARIRNRIERAASGEFLRDEAELAGTNGRRVLFDFSLKPVRSPVSREVRWLIIEGRDITEQRKLQLRLAQSEKMEALGQLAGGVAHDFNNVLQAVSGGARLILRRPHDQAAVTRLAELVVEAAERGAAVSRRLLAFARQGELRARPIEPVPLLHGLREVLAHTLGPAITVQVETPPDLPPVNTDQAQLETALVNLAVNARDAMPEGGALTLSATTEEVAEGAAHPAGLRPGQYVRLAVADTGTGMDPATLSHAVEPFFTTKAEGKGTGLGLAMVKGFAEQSGGGLAIESRPGAGTTVILWLPRARQAVETTAEQQIAKPGPMPPSARVLLVDDEASVRHVLGADLAARGLTVVEASSGTTALALIDGGETPDLLVTDLAMPGMDGVTLVREARRRRPGLPAVLITGYAGDGAFSAMREAVGPGPIALLRKPARPEELADRAAAMLAQRSA